MRKLMLITSVYFLNGLLQAQDFQEQVVTQLQDIHVELFTPAEQEAYTIKPDNRDFYKTDFIIKHEDKVEMRVEYFSWKKDSLAITNPNIKNGIRLGQLMDNNDDTQISLHRLSSQDLNIYGADWATQALFKPKPEFSDKYYCQLITMYKEETGLIFLYLLFDDLEKYKDEWRYVIGFSTPEMKLIK